MYLTEGSSVLRQRRRRLAEKMTIKEDDRWRRGVPKLGEASCRNSISLSVCGHDTTGGDNSWQEGLAMKIF
ncbi:hypothetical protein ACLOJK_031595 [Asimina triloba]